MWVGERVMRKNVVNRCGQGQEPRRPHRGHTLVATLGLRVGHVASGCAGRATPRRRPRATLGRVGVPRAELTALAAAHHARVVGRVGQRSRRRAAGLNSRVGEPRVGRAVHSRGRRAARPRAPGVRLSRTRRQRHSELSAQRLLLRCSAAPAQLPFSPLQRNACSPAASAALLRARGSRLATGQAQATPLQAALPGTAQPHRRLAAQPGTQRSALDGSSPYLDRRWACRRATILSSFLILQFLYRQLVVFFVLSFMGREPYNQDLLSLVCTSIFV